MARRMSRGDPGAVEFALLRSILAPAVTKAAAMELGRGHSVLVSLAQMGCPKVLI